MRVFLHASITSAACCAITSIRASCVRAVSARSGTAQPCKRTTSRLSTDTPERAERRTHLRMCEVGVASARVRQHEHARAFKELALQPKLHANVVADLEETSEDGHADERDDRRFVPLHLLPENLRAGDVFVRPEAVDARCRPCDEVRDAKTPLRQTVVVFGADWLGHDA